MAEICNEWNKIFENLGSLKNQADERYSKFKPLIEYLNEVDASIPESQNIKVKPTIYEDYSQLKKFYAKALML